MSYVPPHKRHSSSCRSTPFPADIHKCKPLDKYQSQPRKIVYAAGSFSRWILAGGGNTDHSPSFKLEPFSCERRSGVKSMVIVGERHDDGGCGGGGEEWLAAIAKRVEVDLAAAAENARKEMVSEGGGGEELKLSFVARVGKIVFEGPSVSSDSIRKAASLEAIPRDLQKTFYTNVPKAYMDVIEHLVVPRIGFEFDSESEFFHVKVFDKSRPTFTISCKCLISQGGKELKIHKVELNQVRQLVVDISCLFKDLDLRLMLCTKRNVKVLTDAERDGLNELVKSALIDPDVKGGLRWPLGKESSADRFSIVGVWHTKCRVFTTQTMRLKLRHADRFDHRTSTGEVAIEVMLKPTALTKLLMDDNMDPDLAQGMIQNAVKLIWDHFLVLPSGVQMTH